MLLLQVVLMSATINCQEFADYFAVPVQNKMNPAYVLEVEGKPHSIEELYLDDLEYIHHGGVCAKALAFSAKCQEVHGSRGGRAQAAREGGSSWA